MRTSTTTLFTFIVFLSYANVQHPQADRKTNPDHETKKRNIDHIEEILLRPDPLGYDDTDPNIKAVQKELRAIYQNMIRPVEKQFRYADLRRHTMSDVDIYAKPMVLLVGPWSTGKSTMINYLLGIEGALESLYVGAEPTTGDFTVLSYGDEYRTVEGVVLATDATKPFASMEKFGQIFLEHLLGVEMNRPLLRNISFIDTPGILENRRQQERGYPYNDVMRWLVHRSDLIFVVFDPTKLDVGYELETLFKQLKGKESVLRIILNKADSMSEQDLMRVYGALFWSLSPLINVTEPPRVYVGSFWGEAYHDDDLAEILLREEKSLLHDMREVIRNRVYNKIAFVRQYAIRVRIHALLVDSFVAAYRRNKGLFGSGDELARQIVEDPEDYDVFKTVLAHPNVSKYDLPDPDEYEEFFRINPLPDQRRVSEHCGYFSGCAYMDQLNKAISHDLPALLRRFQTPNERRKTPFGRQGDFAEWHREHEKKKAAAAAGGQKRASNGASAVVVDTPSPSPSPATGPKKWRKSPPAESQPATPQASQEEEEATPQKQVKKGKAVKTQAPKEEKSAEVRGSKLSGKSKQRVDKSAEEPSTTAAETKEQPKRRKRSKEKVETTETEEQTPEAVPVKEPPPSPRRAPSPAPAPPAEVPEAIHSEDDNEGQVESEAPEEPIEEKPSRQAAKAARKVTASAEKMPKEAQPEPVSPKFQAQKKAGREHVEVRSKKISGEKVAKSKSSKDRSSEQAPAPETAGHKGATVGSTDGTKCSKYRKNCNEGEEEPSSPPAPTPVKVETKEAPHKGSSKKSAEDAKKKATPAPKPAPQPAAPPPNPSVKCNKFRKSCQEDASDDGKNEPAPKPVQQKKAAPEPAPKAAPKTTAPAPAPPSGVKCNKYRKNCDADGAEEPSPKAAEVKKVVEKAKEIKKAVAPPAAAPAAAGGTKCNKYRKNCDQDSDKKEDEKPRKTPVKEEERPQKKQKETHTAKAVPTPTPSAAPVKCNKFRKSCQEGSEAPVVAAPQVKDQRRTKDSSNDDDDDDDDDDEPEVVKPVKCTKWNYRKSCRDKQDEDEDNEKPQVRQEKPKKPEVKVATPAPKSAPAPARGGKCNKYRKDCQPEESAPPPTVKASVKPEKKTETKKAEPKASSVPASAPSGGKCNKYRKSCQTDSDDEPASAPPPPKRPVEKSEPVAAPAYTPSSGSACNRYRKSCQESSGTVKSAPVQEKPAPKAKAAPAAKEEAKPKKLCKKNTTGTTAPGAKKEQQKKGSKAAPAPAPAPETKTAPVQQNKWRKQKTPPAEQLMSS